MLKESVLGYEQHRLQPLRAPRRELFTDTELHAVDEAVALVRDRSAGVVSDLSHRDAAWRLVDLGDDIPFVAAHLAPDQRRSSPAIRSRAERIAAEYRSARADTREGAAGPSATAAAFSTTPRKRSRMTGAVLRD